jgi:hypothetical protein
MSRSGRSVKGWKVEGVKKYLSQTWNDPRIEIRRSPISGSGMFARHPFREGQTVCVVGGTPMNETEFVTFQESHARYNAIQIGEDLHLVEEPGITETLEGSMNHSCDSNVWMEDEVTLVARRKIDAEEEITVDYALFTVQPGWTLDHPCQCGSPYCRQQISGDDWKLKEVQERYRDHFSPFINRRIQALRN